MRVVKVAVRAKRPAVMVNQKCDQSGFMAFVKAHWTGVRRLFWTGLSCCRHRYARIETRALEMLHHQKECMWIRVGVRPTRVQTLRGVTAAISLLSLYMNTHSRYEFAKASISASDSCGSFRRSIVTSSHVMNPFDWNVVLSVLPRVSVIQSPPSDVNPHF